MSSDFSLTTSPMGQAEGLVQEMIRLQLAYNTVFKTANTRKSGRADALGKSAAGGYFSGVLRYQRALCRSARRTRAARVS